MVNIYCVPGCKSNYRSKKDYKKIALFKFVRETESRNKWLKSIAGANWTLGESHRVYAKHFYEKDFIRTFSQSQDLLPLKRLHIKDSAIPHVFKVFRNILALIVYSLVPQFHPLLHQDNADYRHQLQKNEDLLIEDEFHHLTSLK